MLDWEETIQSQYAASPTIKKIVQAVDGHIDPRVDIQKFFDMIFNVDTAEGVGLDIWGRIVGINRRLNITEIHECFGFDGSTLEPFDEGVYWTRDQDTGVFDLSDDAYRKLILWKAMANISTADNYTLNILFKNLFDGKGVYVIEKSTMQIRIVSVEELQQWQQAVINEYGLFCRGAGVGYEFLYTGNVFGFVKDMGLNPFGQAPFYNGSVETSD